MAAPSLTNLISWWKMNETSGVRYDSHGSNDLSDPVSVGYGTGKVGNAAHFINANNDYINHADNADLSVAAQDVGFYGWFNIDSLWDNARFTILAKQDVIYDEYRIDVYKPVAQSARFITTIRKADNSGAVATDWSTVGVPYVSASTWYFVAWWYDHSAQTEYLQINNGTVYSVNHAVDLFYDNIAVFTFGAHSNWNWWFNGLLDEWCMFKDYFLTADERTWMYNSGNGRTYEDIFLDILSANNITITPELADDVECVLTPKKILPHIPPPPYIDVPVYILSPSNLNAIGIIDDYYSIVWTERYNELGEFELVLPIEYSNSSLIDFQNLLRIRSSDRIMVIEDIKPEVSPEKSTVVVKGRSVESILMRRIIPYTIYVSGNIESIAYMLVENNFTDADNTARNISIFKTTFPTPTISITYEEKIKMQEVLYAIESLCIYGSLGYKLELEAGKLAFSLYEGVDRSVGQSENDYVIFSDNFDNVVSSSFYSSEKDKINTVLVATKIIDEYGEEENGGGLSRIFLWDEVSEPSGLNRFESLLENEIRRLEKTLTEEPPPTPPDAPILGVVGKHLLTAKGLEVKPVMGPNFNDPIEVEIPLSDSEITGIIVTRGQEVLDNNRLIGLFEGDFDIYGNFKYGSDFYMGDIVQCVLEGKNVSARVVELVRSYNTQGAKTYVAFDFIS